MTKARPEIAVCIVTHEAAADIETCFASLREQRLRPQQVVVVDCASVDASVEVARRAELGEIDKKVVALGENLGFTGGMNRALQECDAPLCMLLNADACLAPDHLEKLASWFENEESQSRYRIAAVTGRLLRPEQGDEPGGRRIDACGMMLTRSWRHFDRGSDEVDEGQYGIACRVFGATGAATLFRRAALEDVAIDGRVFDVDFHSFREDAELCFRLRERGWEIVYEPAARAEHRRRVLPRRRRQLPPAVNAHSLKNRYLLRRYHQSWASWRKTALGALVRDVSALAYVVVIERSSLWAYRWLWRNRRRTKQRRAIIRARRRVPDATVAEWFGVESLPL